MASQHGTVRTPLGWMALGVICACTAGCGLLRAPYETVVPDWGTSVRVVDAASGRDLPQARVTCRLIGIEYFGDRGVGLSLGGLRPWPPADTDPEVARWVASTQLAIPVTVDPDGRRRLETKRLGAVANLWKRWPFKTTYEDYLVEVRVEAEGYQPAAVLFGAGRPQVTEVSDDCGLAASLSPQHQLLVRLPAADALPPVKAVIGELGETSHPFGRITAATGRSLRVDVGSRDGLQADQWCLIARDRLLVGAARVEALFATESHLRWTHRQDDLVPAVGDRLLWSQGR